MSSPPRIENMTAHELRACYAIALKRIVELERDADELTEALRDIYRFKEPAGSHFDVYRAYVRRRAASVVEMPE